jgi:hypothetical protein
MGNLAGEIIKGIENAKGIPYYRYLEIRLRCVTKPDPPLAVLLDRLDLQVPERLAMKLKMLQDVVPTA